jgi:hypothetical protein
MGPFVAQVGRNNVTPHQKYIKQVLGITNRPLSFYIILSTLYDTDRIENTAFNNCSIVACVFVAAGTCLPSLAMI